MKFVLKLLLGVGVIFGAFFLISELSSPAEGKVEVVQEEVKEDKDVVIKVTVDDEVVVDIDTSESEEVVEEVVEEVFMPLSFKKSLNRFAKDNGAKVVKLTKLEKNYVKTVSGKEVSKGVKIDGALYFKSGSQAYVIYKGVLIKL